MTPERWARVQELFAAALELTPAARRAFVSEASGEDLVLKQEVESLLASHEQATEGFLKSPAVGSADVPRGALDAKARLGPYEILGRLGSGGMGEVYRARDRKLDRDVAIKVLPAHLSASPAALARFEREAKAVAALSHPNILSIFDFGTQDGTAYAVTELLEGETLRGKLDGGAIPPRLAVDYSIQIAKGLAAAHERGVIHRDLKPENIFVSKDGHLKILDFGLAKREEKVAPGEETNAPTASGETQPGTVMGTVGYMSPEQVRAIPADHRSDIFSFGTILYEMLSGKRAFRKESGGETMAAILRDEPPPLTQDVPESLGRIVDHCLAKDRDNRFQSARDVVFALSEPSSVPAISAPSFPVPAPLALSRRRVRVAAAAAGAALLIALGILLWRGRSSNRLQAGPPAPAATKRIVVLPFENQGDAQDAYFAAGMTEEIINRLANLHGVAVISRATAMGYDRKGKTTKQIGTDLGVDYVLGGSIRWDRAAGGESKIRITPELVRVGDDTHLWGERYDRVLADIFAIQSDVAENVCRALNIQLLPREKSAIDAASTSDMEAYDLYLRGLAAANRSRLPKDQEEALTLFEAAVKRDPRFAPALLQLAKAHLYMVVQHVDRTSERVEKARQAVEQLGAVGPDLPETHIARGYLAYRGLEVDFTRAQEEFQKALSLQPNSFEALFGMMAVLRRLGRFDEAAATSGKLIEVDPRNPTALFQHGIDSALARQYAEAERSYALAVSFNPRDGATWGRRAWNQVQWRGDAARAKAILLEASRVAGLDDDRSFAALAAFRVALILGDYRGALQQLENDPRDAFESQFVYYPKALLQAQVHALLGDREQARRDFAVARTDLEKRALEHPDDARYPSALGIALAGLGQRDEALAAAKKSIELRPESGDAWWGLACIEELALVYTMLGQSEEAVAELEKVLSRGGELTTHVLRLDPRWAPLEASPRFQALMTKHGEKK